MIVYPYSKLVIFYGTNTAKGIIIGMDFGVALIRSRSPLTFTLPSVGIRGEPRPTRSLLLSLLDWRGFRAVLWDLPLTVDLLPPPTVCFSFHFGGDKKLTCDNKVKLSNEQTNIVHYY